MTGGVAYVFDEHGEFGRRCNTGTVDLEWVADDEVLRVLVERHARVTGSMRAARVLDDWFSSRERFVKVMPRDYKRVLLERLSGSAPEVPRDAIVRTAHG
jgi:glutamate synthase domain-containing protein 3